MWLLSIFKILEKLVYKRDNLTKQNHRQTDQIIYMNMLKLH